MSRVGLKPIPVPDKVQVQVQDAKVSVKGPLGRLEWRLPKEIGVELKDGTLTFAVKKDAPKGKDTASKFGMSRARVANLISGVQTGFKKEVEIVGLGFRAQAQGQTLTLQLGFSHPAVFEVPAGVKAEVDKKATKIVFSGVDKDLVGETAARLREMKKPEPYKGAGIRYAGERVRRKAGKTAAGSGAGKK